MQHLYANFIYLLSAVIVLLIFVFLLRYHFRRKYKFSKAHNFIVLLLTVPRESISKEEETRLPQGYIHKLISSAETLFANIGGMHAECGLRPFFKGRNDQFALEIVAERDGLISFYLVVPRDLEQYFRQQFQAQYRDVQIEEAPDYNIFDPKGVIIGANLILKKDHCLPIKTYSEMEVDSLNAITNALSRFGPHEGAAIQIVCRSSHPQWHTRSANIAKELQKGKTFSRALRAAGAGGPLDKIISSFSAFLQASMGKTAFERDREALAKNPRLLTPFQEEGLKKLEQKNSKAGLDTNLRLVVSADNLVAAKSYLTNIINSFGQYASYQYANGFKSVDVGQNPKLIENFIYRHFDDRRAFILNSEEIASVFHLPLPMTETPNIRWLLAKKLPAAANLPLAGLCLGESIYRGQNKNVYLKDDDRRRHLYLIGMTGTGKSNLMANLAVQDIQSGKGVGIVDPHGTLIEDILPRIPRERAEDVVIFNPSDIERPVGLNMLEADTPQAGDFAVQEMISIFYKLFPPEMIGPMFEHNMRNVMLTLMCDKENPGTIAEIPRMFSDADFQKQWVAKVTDPVVRAFWEKEMAKTTDFHKSEMLGYLISKVGRFVENAMMRNIIGQTHSGFDFRKIMDQGKIFLVNLSKGTTGEVNSNLLGLIIVSKLQMSALARADMPEFERKDFYLYIDEFQNFITDSISTILAEARKYKLNLTIAHQYIGQLVNGQDTKIRDAVFGNVGTITAFRVGVDDSQTIAKQLGPPVTEFDVMNVEKYHAYLRLLIDNQASRPFNIHCFPPVPGNRDLAGAIKEYSRLKYGRDRVIVEEEILERTRLGDPETKGVIEASEKSL